MLQGQEREKAEHARAAWPLAIVDSEEREYNLPRGHQFQANKIGNHFPHNWALLSLGSIQ